MHELNPSEDFEPSRDTKSLWRYTRKAPARYSGLTLPGLFDTSHFTLDTAAFLIVIVLELWGLQNLLVVGQVAFAYVVGLFLADVLFAIGRHLPQGPICEAENRLVIADDANEQARILASIAHRRVLSYICSFAIGVIAVVKVVSFYALQGGDFNGLTLAILLSYAVAAILHVSCTGYFLAGIATSLLIARDRRAFLAPDRVERAHVITLQRELLFHSSAAVREAKADRQELVRSSEYPGDSGRQAYLLRTWGILTDRQLQSLINEQLEPAAKIDVAREGLRHQLDILQSDVHTATTGDERQTREREVPLRDVRKIAPR